LSLFLVFQESGALQTSLLKRNRRMKQKDCHLMQLRSWGRGPGSVFKSGEQSLSRQRRDTRQSRRHKCRGGVPSPLGEGFGEGAPDDRKYSDETVKKKLCMKP